jgi:Na+-exporting ATPase
MGKNQPSLEGHKSGQANEPLTKPAHALTFQEVVEQTKCNADDGLITSEAKSRLEKHGSNDLGEDGGVSPGKILLRQVANAMTLVSFLSFCYNWKESLTIPDLDSCHGRQFRH